LRKKQLPFTKSKAALARLNAEKSRTGCDKEGDDESVDCIGDSIASVATATVADIGGDVAKPHPREKKTVDFKGKVYIAPLTTVGNLPFRRIMKDFGADITCGEMALCQNLLEACVVCQSCVARMRGVLRRVVTGMHQSGRYFVAIRARTCLASRLQYASLKGFMFSGSSILSCGGCYQGSQAAQMSRLAEVIESEVSCDFVDLNLGCPIDALNCKGLGAMMMGRPSRLRVRGSLVLVCSTRF
jgi:tRNA-dihydrouridine synthase 3